MLRKKIISRTKLIFSGGAFRIVGMLGSAIISLFIIRTQSQYLWGEVVSFILFLDLGHTAISWGNSTFLNREFSRNPGKISYNLISSIVSRSLLVLIFLAIVLFMPFSAEIKLALFIWCVARFIYQSFDPLTFFQRNFIFALVVEILGIIVVIIPFALEIVVTETKNIIFVYALSFTIRALAVLIFYSNFYLKKGLSININSLKDYLRTAFPFLLLTLSSMLQQRIDLYTTAILLTPIETASYQVFLNFLLMGQFGASLILSPYTKNIFRMKHNSIQSLEKKFIQAGLLLSLITVIFTYLAIKYLYKIELSFLMYFMGYFYILMFYIYLVKNYEMGKAYRQVAVAFISFTGLAISVLMSILLIPRFGIEGAMIAGLTSQVLVTILYKKSIKKIRNAPH